jgi:hypothetical protein
MRELDVENVGDDELREVLFDNVTTGNETAAMRKDIKYLYSIMNREELLQQVQMKCGGKLYEKPRYRVVSDRELKRREVIAERKAPHIPIKHIDIRKESAIWTAADDVVCQIGFLACVKAVELFDAQHIGVILIADTKENRDSCARVARLNKYEGEIIYYG